MIDSASPGEDRPAASAVGTILLLKLITNSTFRFVYPFLPAIGRGLGIGIERAGVLLSVRWAASLATPAALSVLRPRIASRRMLILGTIGFALGSAITAASNAFIGALAGFVVLGLTKPFVDIAGQTHIAARTRYGVRARYIGILEMAWAGGLLVGAPVAGWLIEWGDWRTPFWTFASLAVLGVGASMAFLSSHDGVPIEAVTIGGLGATRRIITFLGSIVLIGFAHESLLVVLGSWLEGAFGLTLLALGGVGTLLGLSDLAGEGLMVAFTDRIGKRRSIVLGASAAAAGLVALAIVADLFVPAMAALAFTMLGTEFGYISGIPLATEIRPHDRTRVLGWFYIATGSGRIIGDLVAPGLFTRGDMRVVAIVAAVTMSAAAVLLTTVRAVGGNDVE